MGKKKQIKNKKPWKGADVLQLNLRIPSEVVMLCKLMNTRPHDVVQAFLSCLAVEKDKDNPEEAKQACADFFIHYGFGNSYYSKDEIRQMFAELGKVNDLMPENPSMKFLDQHCSWERKYNKQWFKSWFWRIRRR
jgi:hypothetical protein